MRRFRLSLSVSRLGLNENYLQLGHHTPPRCGRSLKRSFNLISLPLFLIAALGAAAQSVSVPTPTTLNVSIPTISSSEPVELTTHETISLSSGAVAFSLPVVSLPQRGGQTLNIGFVLSGNQYVLRETGNSYQTSDNQGGEIAQLQTTVQNSPVFSVPWGTVLHPNVPTLSADSSYAGTDIHNANPPTLPVHYINKPEYCMQNWTFTDWDGSSHSFPGTRDCNNGDGEYFQWSETFPLATVSVVSNDESNYILDASNTNDIHVTKRDGTVYHFVGGYVKPPSAGNCNSCISMQDDTILGYYSAFVSSIVDSNGNTITTSPTSQGLTIVDTVGRQVTISNNAITYTAQNGSGTKSVSANVAQLTSSGATVAWPVDYDSYQTSNSAGPCSVSPINSGTIEYRDGFQQPTVVYQGPGFHDTGQYVAQTSYQITLPNPNGTSPPPTYTLTFDVTGNVIKVQYPSGGYTKYDYSYGRIMQSKNFGDSNCVMPTNELLAKHECAQSNGSCTPAPTATATNACVAGFPSGGEATTCYSGLFREALRRGVDL